MAKKLELPMGKLKQILVKNVIARTNMQLLKDNILNYIKQRTLAGYGVDRIPFAPYSDSYAKLRAEGGLKTRPSLAKTGTMIMSLKIEDVHDGTYNKDTDIMNPILLHCRIKSDDEVRAVTKKGKKVTNSDLVRFHTKGTKNKDNSERMPARPFLKVDPAEFGEILKRTMDGVKFPTPNPIDWT